MRTIPSLLFLFLFFLAPAAYSQPKAILSGTVKSLDGNKLPQAHVILKPYSDNLFYHSEIVEVRADNSFQISIPRSGIYRLTVIGAMHKSMNIPIWIRKPDSMEVDITLDPKNLDDGEYFNSNEYISWIRVTGNFNGYNYDRGVRFERVGSKTIRATITTSLDTLHYQVTGLTSGTTVLPGAEDYRLRDSRNYEAVVPVKNDKVVLTYKADSTYFDNKNPFKGYRTTWDFNQSEFQFSEKTEQQIHKNLDSGNYFSRLFNYAIFDSDSLTMDKFEYSMRQINRDRWNLYIEESGTLETRLNNLSGTLDDDLLQSMYYKYLLLCEDILDIHNSGLLTEIDTEPNQYINSDILRASMDAIPPESPLWSFHKELILTLPGILGYSTRVSNYLEEAVMKHPDNDVTGRVLYRLFTHSYDSSGRSERTKKYYRLILDAFGDNYYARKARDYVQENN